MKAINQSKEAGSPAPSLRERLQAVDVSSLDRLLAIRDEQRRIDEYRAKAESLKSSVAGAVHARVVDDYGKRAAALARQSAPLQAQARAEYRKLAALVDEVARARDQAQLEKQELEFRHAVGEFDDQQLAERLQGPQAVLDRCQNDQAVLDEQVARFEAALGPEGKVEAPARTAGPPVWEQPTSEGPEPLPASEAPTGATLVVSAVGPVPGEPPVSTDKTLLVGDLTRIASPEEMEKVKASLAGSEKRAPAVPPAALLMTDSTAAPHEYRLGEVNGIGRSDQNAIHIVRPGVSRTHALVTSKSNGFVIKDLDSQNGTYVNGERIGERPLADGDTIEIGTVQFVFRMPWPAAGGASGASAGHQTRR